MKKIISVFLALLMLIGTVSCASDNSETQETNAETTADETTEDEEAIKKPEIAKNNYNADFKILTYQDFEGKWFYAKDSIGEVLNDTIFDMNCAVEDYLGVEIKYKNEIPVTGNEIYDEMKPLLNSDDDEYQLIITHPYYCISSLINDNALLDLESLEGIDLSREYWNETEMEKLEINNSKYIGLGDICFYTLNILYFNKDLMTEIGKTAPYDDVRNKEWTLDKFISETQDVYKDLDGQGRKDNKDRYGFACCWDANGSAFQQSSEIYTMTMNSDGKYDISIYSDKLVELYDKIYAFCNNESSYVWTYGDRDNPNINIDFTHGTVLYTLADLKKDFLVSDVRFGIAPLPLYSTSQKNYAHVNWGSLLCVPRTVTNTKMVGNTIEMMAYYSKTLVQKAYYESVLGSKVADTEDDWEMIQLIYDTVVFDPAIAFCQNNSALYNLVYCLCFGVRNKQKSAATYCKKNLAQAQKYIDKLFVSE